MRIAAKGRARQKGIPFTIETEDIVIPKVCPVLGIPLARGSGERSNNSPSLDKIVDHLGYVKGNVAVISWRANNIKSDATVEELAAVLRYLRKHIRRQKRGL